jgi:ankyrin repeat protein
MQYWTVTQAVPDSNPCSTGLILDSNPCSIMAAHAVLDGLPRRLLQVGTTPLHTAAKFGSKEVVAQLLGAGASVDALDKVQLCPRG